MLTAALVKQILRWRHFISSRSYVGIRFDLLNVEILVSEHSENNYTEEEREEEDTLFIEERPNVFPAYDEHGSLYWVESERLETPQTEEDEYNERMAFIRGLDIDSATDEELDDYFDCKEWCKAYRERNTPRKLYPKPHIMLSDPIMRIKEEISELDTKVRNLKSKHAALPRIDIHGKQVAITEYRDAKSAVLDIESEIHDAETEEPNPPRLARLQAEVDALHLTEMQFVNELRTLPWVDSASLSGPAFFAAKKRRDAKKLELTEKLQTCHEAWRVAYERLIRAREIRLIAAKAEEVELRANLVICERNLDFFRMQEAAAESILIQIQESEEKLEKLKSKLLNGYTVITVPPIFSGASKAVGGAGAASSSSSSNSSSSSSSSNSASSSAASIPASATVKKSWSSVVKA